MEIAQALLGGTLIGLAASLMWLLNGRIAGVSGILQGTMDRSKRKDLWRWCFLGGLFAVGMVTLAVSPEQVSGADLPLWQIALGGLLVGFGSVLGGGCTSGHGVCGVGRLSIRSLVATVVFMAMGFLTVWIVRHSGWWP